MEKALAPKSIFSRREILKGVGIGIAGALVCSVVSRRLLSFALGRRSKTPVFPEGSIFTPAQGRRPPR